MSLDTYPMAQVSAMAQQVANAANVEPHDPLTYVDAQERRRDVEHVIPRRLLKRERVVRETVKESVEVEIQVFGRHWPLDTSEMIRKEESPVTGPVSVGGTVVNDGSLSVVETQHFFFTTALMLDGSLWVAEVERYSLERSWEGFPRSQKTSHKANAASPLQLRYLDYEPATVQIANTSHVQSWATGRRYASMSSTGQDIQGKPIPRLAAGEGALRQLHSLLRS